MEPIFLEKVDFREEDLVLGLMNKIDVQFVVNGRNGTAVAITDEQLKLKMMYDIKIEGVDDKDPVNSFVAFFLGQALRESLKEFRNK